MYDRKTWFILILCGGLFAVNYYYMRKNQEAQRMVEWEKQQKSAVIQKDKPSSTPAAGSSLTPIAEPINVAQQKEELITLETPDTIFTFTNQGGGVKFSEFKHQFEVGSSTQKIKMNAYGKGAITALMKHGEIERVTYNYKPDQSIPNQKMVMIGQAASGLIIKKIFTLNDPKDAGSGYLLNTEIIFENTSDSPIDLDDYSFYLGEANLIHEKETPEHLGFFWSHEDEFTFKNLGKFSGSMFSKEVEKITSPIEETLNFAGVSNQFFSTVMKPKEMQGMQVWGKKRMLDVKTSDDKPQFVIDAGLSLGSKILSPKEQYRIISDLFIGPKHNPMLRKMEDKMGSQWADIMEYGMFWWVSRPLNWLLNTYHHLFNKMSPQWSWGLAIIFMTITVRFAIWPLHAKSQRTMKRMSGLQPEMLKIKEKYANDPTKMNQETMLLYRKYGINPIGGCLPMLLQIPIFYGFFTMLKTAVELRNQGFLWVHDLSQPDTLMHLSFLGNVPFNILPIVMAGTSILQMKMMPQSGDKTQQRIMLFMPLIFFFFCYNFASALALYWTVQNIFSIGQTWFMSRMPEPQLKPVNTNNKKTWLERMMEKQAELQKQQKKGNMRNVTPNKSQKK